MLPLLSVVLLRNYNSNLIGSGKTVTVVGNEFDRSFCICIPILRA
jgi:hypothetical protein